MSTDPLQDDYTMGHVSNKCACTMEPCAEVKDLIDSLKSLATWTEQEIVEQANLYRGYIRELLQDWLPEGKGGIR
jgi:hypothetical protein